MMISRRKIITSGQPNAAGADQVATSSSSSASSRPSNSSHSNTNSRHQHHQQPKLKQQQLRHQQQPQMIKSDDYVLDSSTMSQQHAYEEYLAPEVEPSWRADKHQVRANQHNQHHPNHQQDTDASYQGDRFDPYDVDEEDVYGCEQRLFEDHLFEIYNKWPLLDDDIWCKLIIMERNRRIGKAYARVPIVTIDGSHELSYDGYKLALNGFDNPDRDAETEECRKRIGKGIRIKMDNFGNILIKRLSKAGVYVKEWINPATQISGGSSNSTNGSSGAGVGRSMPSRQQLIKAASMGGAHQMSLLNSGATPTSPGSSGGSSMDAPNDSAICDEVINIGGRLSLDKIYVMFDMKKFQANITQELYRAIPDRKKLEQQCFSIVGLTRDSEDILNLPCWVMVINIVAIEMLNERFPPLADHQLGRHGLADFPDTRRLNHSRPQAPSFVSIFDRPESRAVAGAPPGRGKLGASTDSGANKEEDPYSMPANASSSDVKSSINDYGATSAKNMSNYIESTDHQSSRYYGNDKAGSYLAPARRNAGGDMSAPTTRQSELLMMRHRSKSHYNIYGPGGAKMSSSAAANGHTERYNNSSSIYSPGHMLVPPSAGDHSVPPKLPPRDFIAKRIKSKSSSNVNNSNSNSNNNKNNGSQFGETDQMSRQPAPNFYDPNENIYSTRDELNIVADRNSAGDDVKVVRKSKKNRFLESLKAPLELAKSSRSASVMGAPTERSATATTQANQNSGTENAKKSPSSKTKRNLRSFLGVGSKSSNAVKDTTSEDSNYVHVDCNDSSKRPSKATKCAAAPMPTSAKIDNTDNTDADSAVDPNDDIDDSQQIVTNSSASPAASYNDLDIPTPDYETDENIYALDEGSHYNANQKSGATDNDTANAKQKGAGSNRTRRYSTANGGGGAQSARVKSTKDDLYYSGFRAHVPHGINHHGHGGAYMPAADRYNHGQAQQLSGADDRMSGLSGSAAAAAAASANSRYLMRTSRMLAAKMGGRDKIYGSTLGLHQQQSMTGSRYRSASMQRYYPSTTMRPSAGHFSNSSACDYDYPPHYYQQGTNRSHNEIAYDQDAENPYAMSAGSAMLTTANSTIPLDSGAGHYGLTAGGGGGVSRRRSVSKAMPAQGRTVAPSLVGSTSHYDMGRSSSGIYGNNSSSSSSEYADWQPQVRKVNSSGYLNSIFKTHKLSTSSATASSALGAPTAAAATTTNKTLLATAQMHGSFSSNSGQVDPLNNNSSSSSNNNNSNNNNNINNNNSNNNNGNNKALMGAHAYHQSNNMMNVNGGPAAATKTSSQVRNATRALKVTCDNNLTQAGASKQQQQQKQKQQTVSSALNGPAYRSYDSSNDSDPSYTNSSDGIDIYDQIGSHTRTTNHQRRQHNQFLDHNLAPEVHVGEWENMYDR